MHPKLYCWTNFITVYCFLLLDIRTVSCEGCDIMKTMFVNKSDTMVFKVDYNEMGSIFDRLFPFSYFEFYFALKPDREMILHMSKSGYIEFIDKRYVNRTKAMVEKNVLEIVINDTIRRDGGIYTVDIPRARASVCFTVYVLGSPKKPNITASSQTVEEGSPITLNCTSSSTTYPPDHNQKLVYTWEINAEPLFGSGSNIRFNVKKGILKILRADRRDRNRRIICRVHEGFGLASYSSFSPNVTWGPKLILDLEPPSTVYHLHAGEKVPMVTCKTDCYPACDVTWHKVGVNSSSVYNLENVLSLGTFETDTAGEYICVANRRGTNKVGFRGVTFKLKAETDTFKQKSTTDTSRVTVVGGVLGALLFLSLVAIVCLIIGVLRLERLRRKRDNQIVKCAPNGTTMLSSSPNDNSRTYEELDEKTRNQHTYEAVQRGAANIITDASNQSTIYENQST